MKVERRKSLEQFLAGILGCELKIVGIRNCSGGCIHRAEILTLSDGRELFIKSGRNAADMLAQEAIGLAALASTNTIRVPRVIAAGPIASQGSSEHPTQNEHCLILEAIPPSPPPVDFWICFGEQVARLHRSATSPTYGWNSHNYIGSTHQLNSECHNWCEFWGEQRLGFQLQLAQRNSHGTSELFRLGARLIERLETRIGPIDDPPSLLHGDLWSGNYLIDQLGQPVLIDPAVYYGHREADLAMPLLFGGFPPAFFEAYQDVWPLEAGWRERNEVYQLYHLLNHLNLFGRSYLDGCLASLRRLS